MKKVVADDKKTKSHEKHETHTKHEPVKHEQPKEVEKPKQEAPKQDPRDVKIEKMRALLTHLKDNVLQGSQHVAGIESVLRD